MRDPNRNRTAQVEDIPFDDLCQLRSQAALNGQTQKEYMLEILCERAEEIRQRNGKH